MNSRYDYITKLELNSCFIFNIDYTRKLLHNTTEYVVLCNIL